MHSPSTHKPASFLLRLKEQDTPTGVSEATVQKLMAITGLGKTELAHLALRDLAVRFIPQYEMDEGPLTPHHLQAIRALSAATGTPDAMFTERLFE